MREFMVTIPDDQPQQEALFAAVDEILRQIESEKSTFGKSSLRGRQRRGGKGSSHKGSRWEVDITELVQKFAQRFPAPGKVRNPTLDKTDYAFKKKILHTLIRNVLGQRVFVTSRARHIFFAGQKFRQDRARYIHFLIPTLLNPLEIWKSKDGEKDFYFGGFFDEPTNRYIRTFVVVPKNVNTKDKWDFEVSTLIPNRDWDRVRNEDDFQLAWAIWRDEPVCAPKIISRKRFVKSAKGGRVHSINYFIKRPASCDLPHPECLEQIALVPLNTKADKGSRLYPQAGFIKPFQDDYTIPHFNLWEKSTFGKAIKRGGRAHAGLKRRQVRRVKKQSHRIADVERDRFERDLMSLVNEWNKTAKTWQGYHRRYGVWASERHLDKLQRSFEARARHIIRRHYRNQWMHGRRSAGNMLPMTASEEKQLRQMQRNEQQFFINLLRDVRYGTWGMSPWLRVPMYANASKEAFHAGKVLADLSPDVYWKWVVNHDSEHCGDCQKMAQSGRWENTAYAGIYSAWELSRIGVFPASGELQCCTHCHCELRRVARPPIAPRFKKPVTKVLLRGVKHNSFNTMGRTGRERLQNKAEGYKWNFRGRIKKAILNLWSSNNA